MWTSSIIKRFYLGWYPIEIVYEYMILNILLLNSNIYHFIKILVWAIIG